MSFIDDYPYNIEGAQKLVIQWSPEIEWNYDSGYPNGEENVFDWSTTFIPYKINKDSYEVFHVWMRYKIGDKGNWSIPMRVNYPITVKGEKGDKGKTGERGYRGIRGTEGKNIEVQYADKDYNIVPNTSELIVFIRIRLFGESWTSWVRIAGIDGIAGGGIGLPPGGLPNQLVERTSTGYVWVDEDDIYNDTDAVNAMGALGDSNPLNHNRYTDLEAVSAMGIKDNSNPLNHDRYTDAEASAAALADISATNPITYSAGIIGHDSANGNKHIPIGGNANDSLRTDGSGNYSWIKPLDYSQLSDIAGIGDTDKVYSADKILSLIGALDSYGIRFVVSLITDLPTITGMALGDLALCDIDTNRPVYRYDGSNWIYFFDMDAVHNHDTRYYKKTEIDNMLLGFYTKTELQTSGSALVHWDNITNAPPFLELSNFSAISPIDYDNTTGVISHETFTSALNQGGRNVLQEIITDGFGHIDTKSFYDLESELATLTFDTNQFSLTVGASLIPSGTFEVYADLSESLELNFAGVNDLWGSDKLPARSDHKHAAVTKQIKVANLLSGNDVVLQIVDGIIVAATEVSSSAGSYFTTNTQTLEQSITGNNSIYFNEAVSGDVWGLGTLPTGVTISPTSGTTGITNISLIVDSTAPLGTYNIELYNETQDPTHTTVLDTLSLTIIAQVTTPEGSFNSSDLYLNTLEVASLNITYNSHSSSDIGWEIVNVSGIYYSTFNPTTGVGDTTVSVTATNHPLTTTTYNLISTPSGDVLDTLTINT